MCEEFIILKDDILFLKGDWTIENINCIKKQIPSNANIKKLDASMIEQIDTFGGIIIFNYFKSLEIIDKNKKVIDILNIISQHYATPPKPVKTSSLLKLSNFLENIIQNLLYFLAFIGELVINVFTHIKDFEFGILIKDIENNGVKALGIVGILSFLIGVVITYQSAAQLRQFGANIFIVNLLGISIVRELGPLIVAIIISGRSASAYTASIGLMKVQEEIDNLKVLGISPYVLLVLPKIISMMFVLPALIIYADTVSIIGGMIVSKISLNIAFVEFIHRLRHILNLETLFAGLIKGPFFGLFIAIIGTSEGFKVQEKPESIGEHVIASVVKSISSVIMIDAIFSVVYKWIGI